MLRTNFIKQAEVQMMHADFDQLLGSPEASVLSFEFNTGVGTGVIDPTYHTTDYASGVMAVTVTGKGLQKIVHIRDEHLLRFGVLEIGDSIFYFSNNVDLTQGIPDSLEIIDPGGVRWTPVPRTLHAFNNYIAYRLGNSQVAQVLACKVKK